MITTGGNGVATGETGPAAASGGRIGVGTLTVGPGAYIIRGTITIIVVINSEAEQRGHTAS